MKILYRYIIKEHLPPFFIAMGVLTFLFLSNFIVKSIDRILGKGLSIWIILEYVGLNLMWILALSIPMAVLVSILMSYGRMSADNEINAMRTSGISFLSIITPSLIFGTVVCIFMIWFNNHILPDFNHQARLLGADIYRKKPDLTIEPGYFINDLPDYSMRVRGKKNGLLEDVLIFSKGQKDVQTTISAKTGSLSVVGNNIVLTLYSGEIHEVNTTKYSEYRMVKFDKHVITVADAGMVLERHESGRRGDREMSSKMMLSEVDTLKKRFRNTRQQISTILEDQIGLNIPSNNVARLQQIVKLRPDSVIALRSDSLAQEASAHRQLRQEIRVGQQRLNTNLKLSDSYRRQINKYMSEIHKKYSIPVACIVFVLIGAPLGIMARHGGFAVGAGFSLFFFLVYWAGLIGGEELADRMIISPFFAMWTPNLVVGALGIWLTIRTYQERSNLEWSWLRKLRKRRSEKQENE